MRGTSSRAPMATRETAVASTRVVEDVVVVLLSAIMEERWSSQEDDAMMVITMDEKQASPLGRVEENDRKAREEKPKGARLGLVVCTLSVVVVWSGRKRVKRD